ncbi:MAG: hydrogenase maturation nickel metallochaperone HypA [Planctomycetia bacterium]
MHELSIAASIVETAAEHLRRLGGGLVRSVNLRIGALSCVHEDALRYGFELVREGTPLATATLAITAVPVRIWCPVCRLESELPGIQRFACPACGHLSGDIRAGRELEIESLVIEPESTAEPACAGERPP